IGDLMLLQHASDKRAPLREMSPKMGRRQAPEQLVAEMQVDPVDAVAPRDQSPAKPIEETRDRALQKQNRARLHNGFAWGSTRGGAETAGRARCIGLVLVHPATVGLRGIERGEAAAGAPALMREPDALQK